MTGIDLPPRLQHLLRQQERVNSGSDVTLFSPVRIVRDFAVQVAGLSGWRGNLVAFSSGAASALSLAPYHFLPALFVTLPVLVWLLDGKVAWGENQELRSGLQGIWPFLCTGWLFGFGYFLAGLWWVGQAFLVDADEFAIFLPIAVIALPAGLSLFWGLATAMARIVWQDGWIRIVGLASSITLMEWIRGTVFSGFPWNVPGYAAMPSPVLMQSASLIGLYGVTFLLLVVASSTALFAPSPPHLRPSIILLLVSVVISFAHWGYGKSVLSNSPTSFVEGVKLRIVQPAVKQSEKWEDANEMKIMTGFLDLSMGTSIPGAAAIEEFTHIVWPESAFPFMISERPEQLAAIAALLPDQTKLITGAMRPEKPGVAADDRKVYNSVYVINGDGEFMASRDKVWLVPFGEYLPFQEMLESVGLEQLTRLRGGFSPGEDRQVVSLPGSPAFLPLICYEIIFAGVIRPTGEHAVRPDWIVNLTNDAWFGLTAGPYQHAHQSQVRAAEEGLPIVRAANSGISFVSDGHGRIVASLGLGKRGIVDSGLPRALKPTLYSRTGNFPTVFFVCLLLLFLLALQAMRRKKL